MDIKYSRPGVMEVTLDVADIARLDADGYTMSREGLYGHDSKTHIRQDYSVEEPMAELDGDADVTVRLPQGEISTPVFIGREALTGFGPDLENRLNWFFGEEGGIKIIINPEI